MFMTDQVCSQSLSLRFVSLRVLAYGFLLFLLSPFYIEKVLDQIPIKEQVLSYHVPLQSPVPYTCKMVLDSTMPTLSLPPTSTSNPKL